MKRFRLTYVQLIVLGFFLLILAGTALLCLPVATRSHVSTSFLDAFFTATSATCVTGLIVFDTFTYWSLFGQIVILLLIQVGGLGFMTVFTLFSMLTKRQIGLRERMFLMQSAGSIELAGVVRMIRRVLIGTLLVEGGGALLLSIRFVSQFGWGMGLYRAVFTSVSAFCNAGFDLMGGNVSLTEYATDPLVMIPVMLLIVIGGIGFLVWNDIVRFRFRFRQYSLHSKVVLSATAVLIVIGAILFFLFERHGALEGMSFGEGVLQSFFLSITPRTAGFAGVDYASLTESGHLLTMFLMVIGGSAGSTAGGIKVTTFVILLLDTLASSRQANQITIFKRRLDEKLLKQAVAVFMIYASLVTAGSMLICAIQPLSLRDVLFEAISAASTVGLSTGITSMLAPLSKCVVILLMFGGRVGGLTLALLVSEKRTPPPIDRPSEKVLVG